MFHCFIGGGGGGGGGGWNLCLLGLVLKSTYNRTQAELSVMPRTGPMALTAIVMAVGSTERKEMIGLVVARVNWKLDTEIEGRFSVVDAVVQIRGSDGVDGGGADPCGKERNAK